MRKSQQVGGFDEQAYPPMPYPQMAYNQNFPELTGAVNYRNTNQQEYGFYPPPAGPNGQQFGGMPSQIFQNPMVTNMAMQYGQNFMEQSKEMVNKELNKYVSSSRVKYYFSVDNKYVMKKLSLLLFPFTHRDWGVRYNPEEPLQPRYELNAPDLYIPLMAFVTYVVLSAVSLGLQNRFSPEVLGIQASSVIVWAVIEVLAVWVTLYILSIQTPLKILDLFAFSSYKYVGMIATILATFMVPSVYQIALMYFSLALIYFLIRSLRARVLVDNSPRQVDNAYGSDDVTSSGMGSSGSKRRSYLLLFIAGMQPLLMWWMTRSLVRIEPIIESLEPL